MLVFPAGSDSHYGCSLQMTTVPRWLSSHLHYYVPDFSLMPSTTHAETQAEVLVTAILVQMKSHWACTFEVRWDSTEASAPMMTLTAARNLMRSGAHLKIAQ